MGVYAYGTELSQKLQKFGIIIHELIKIEYVLIQKLKMSDSLAHKIANIVERILTFGKSKIIFKRLFWNEPVKDERFEEFGNYVRIVKLTINSKSPVNLF